MGTQDGYVPVPRAHRAVLGLLLRTQHVLPLDEVRNPSFQGYTKLAFLTFSEFSHQEKQWRKAQEGMANLLCQEVY